MYTFHNEKWVVPLGVLSFWVPSTYSKRGKCIETADGRTGLSSIGTADGRTDLSFIEGMMALRTKNS